MLSCFIDEFPKNKYILTSRPSAGAKYLERFENYYLSNLDDEDVKEFTLKQLNLLDYGEDIKKGLLESLNNALNNQDSNVKTFLTNPLLLSIYILTYKNSPNIPDKKSKFYERVLNALYYQHDATTKVGFIRKRVSELSDDQIDKVLKKFSFSTYVGSNYSWDKSTLIKKIKGVKEKFNLEFSTDNFINDLTVSIALWAENDGEYTFSHRSFQEYFTALYIKDSKAKKDIYTKLLRQFLKKNIRLEINNLLLLLEEIDEEAFVEYFKLPLFEEVNAILKNNPKDFLSHHLLGLYSLGCPEQIVKDFHPLYILIKKESKKLKINLNETLGYVLGINIGLEMGMKMGMKMGMGMRMAIEMRMEMGRGIGIGIGREIGEKMRIKNRIRMGIEIGTERAMEMEEEIEKGIEKRIEKEIEREMEMEIGTEIAIKDLKDLKEKIVKWQLNRIKEKNLKSNHHLYKEKNSHINYFIGYISLTTENMTNIRGLPLAKTYKIVNLFKKISQDSPKSEQLMSLAGEYKDKWLSIDDFPEKIITIFADEIKNEYTEYKQFINEKIEEMKTKKVQFKVNDDDDLASL